jgi:hypothetical protein
VKNNTICVDTACVPEQATDNDFERDMIFLNILIASNWEETPPTSSLVIDMTSNIYRGPYCRGEEYHSRLMMSWLFFPPQHVQTSSIEEVEELAWLYGPLLELFVNARHMECADVLCDPLCKNARPA